MSHGKTTFFNLGCDVGGHRTTLTSILPVEITVVRMTMTMTIKRKLPGERNWQ